MKESPGGEAGASPKEKTRPEGLWTPGYYPKARDAQSKGLRCAAIVPSKSLRAAADAIEATPWMWTLAPTHGYAGTREAAMAAFAKSWRRE